MRFPFKKKNSHYVFIQMRLDHVKISCFSKVNFNPFHCCREKFQIFFARIVGLHILFCVFLGVIKQFDPSLHCKGCLDLLEDCTAKYPKFPKKFNVVCCIKSRNCFEMCCLFRPAFGCCAQPKAG